MPLLGHSTLVEILLYAGRNTQKRNVRKAQKVQKAQCTEGAGAMYGERSAMYG